MIGAFKGLKFPIGGTTQKPVKCDDAGGAGLLPPGGDPTAGGAVADPGMAGGPDPAAIAAAQAEMERKTCCQYDHYSKEWMGLSNQDTFDGFRIEAAKPITKNLQTTHSLFLGTAMREQPYAYNFGAMYNSDDGRSFITGSSGLDGTLSARAAKKVNMNPFSSAPAGGNMNPMTGMPEDAGEANDRIDVDLKANVSSSLGDPQRNMMELSADMNLSKLATSMKLVQQGIWIGNFGFSQKVTQELHMGGEMTYLALPQNGQTMGALGARYASGDSVLSVTLGRTPDFKAQQNPMMAAMGGNPNPHVHGLRAQFHHQVSPRLSLGSEFEYSHPDHDSVCRFGYAYTFATARVQGLLDTAGKCNCYINDFKSGFGVSGMIDYLKNDYKFGFLVNYFPQQDAAGGAPPM